MIELVIALSVIAVGVLAFVSSFSANLRANNVSSRQDVAMAALENATEALRNSDFGELYNDFDGAALEAPGLEDPYGGTASIGVECFVDELNLPAEFGPLQDLDGSGGLESNDVSTGYQLLPIRLTLDYAVSYGTETRQVFMVLGL